MKLLIRLSKGSSQQQRPEVYNWSVHRQRAAESALRPHEGKIAYRKRLGPPFQINFPLQTDSLAKPSNSKEEFMFATLDDQMKHDDAASANPKQRMVKWAVIALAAVVLFGGLLFAIQALA